MPAQLSVSSEEDLTNALSEPYPEDIEFASQLDGDVIVLGAGGKMGPTLVRRMKAAVDRAGTRSRIFAASRFSDESSRKEIVDAGADVISADLLDDKALYALPECRNVIHLVGMKFGSSGKQPLTWALNSYLPGRVAVRYKNARILVLSTGNVYAQVPSDSGGSKEEDPPEPVGEYAQSCLGRERIFEHFSSRNGTPVCIVRLNYAVEARYGVFLDVATKVYNGEPVSLSMGYVNTIWQGDANSVCMRALDLCDTPAEILNLTGPEVISVRKIAETFGKRFGVEPVIEGTERPTAFLSDASRCHELFGKPHVKPDEVIDLVAGWVEAGRAIHGKPTKFEVHDGRF